MKKKTILIILTLGVIYRLFLTSGGNFLFNMDNARDFLDVREMVELNKLRLTGPNSAIEGLYNGPAWYYLLLIPYVITQGNPYGAILMEIILWVIGGWFLLKLVLEFSKWLLVPIGLVWVASNYIVLTNLYSFNPNPVTLLTPVFVYSLVKFLEHKKVWIILTWFLAGAFFNFEMNIGIWLPLIIFTSVYLVKKNLLKSKYFWTGALMFITFLMPQILFDYKHDFIMSKGVLRFLSESKGGSFDILKKINSIYVSFYNVFEATLMNQKLLTSVTLVLMIPTIKSFLSKKNKNITAIVISIFILIPFVGYVILPVSVNPWHLGGVTVAFLIFVAFALLTIWKINFFGKLLTLTLSFFLILFSIFNIINFFVNDFGKPSSDPSLYKNEIAAIDYVYKYASGKNFRVYTYLPSVYDYPYQYLFWWYGKKTYGYIPGEYVYLPNRPLYVPSQDKFQGRKDNLSELVFLIKEPNRNYTRFGWEGELLNFEKAEKQMIGPIEIEIRKEIRK